MPVEAYHRPTSLDDALDLAAEHDSSLEVISGGTITMREINDGYTFPDHVLDLRDLGLDYVDGSDGQLTLGATVTLTDVMESVDLSILKNAAKNSGSWATRNMATVGGNLFAPPPLGDFAVALLALDGMVRIQGPDDDRWVPLADFYAGPGARALASDELVTAVRIPVDVGQTAYLKQTRNQEPAPPIVTVAANVDLDGDEVESASIAMNGAGAHPVRMHDAEAELEGSPLDDATIEGAAEAAREEADPPEDAVASAWYRRRMVGTYLTRALGRIAEPEDAR